MFMSKYIIFHLPYKIDPNKPSASQIRPVRLINAFKNRGFEVDIVMGNSSDRKRQIKDIKRNIKSGRKYEFLYSESSTMPTLLTDSHHLPLEPLLDFSFFKFCKEQSIPIGLFYRDMHWKFPFYNKDASTFKKLIARVFYKYDLVKYRSLVDVLFLPSVEMAEYLPELKNLKIKELPPGLIIPEKYENLKMQKSTNILYVGGLSSDIYDISLFAKVIERHKNIKLTICCRQYDLNALTDDVKNQLTKVDNIRIVHESGDGLLKLYQETDICSLFLKPIEYWKFAMPAKLFEYISFLKPIISIKNTKAGKYVQENHLGWEVNHTEEDLDNLLTLISRNKNILPQEFHSSLMNSRQSNTWESRVDYINHSLTIND